MSQIAYEDRLAPAVSFSARPASIFIFCIIYGFHMVEEFCFGFVEWGDVYFGSFDWTQNLFGNAVFLILLAAACYAYYKNPVKYLLAGMSSAMWVLGNAFLHISATILGREYSPGIVTAVIFYIPAGLYFLAGWNKRGLVNGKNLIMSFIVGAMLFMIVPTFVRTIITHGRLAVLFHLIR